MTVVGDTASRLPVDDATAPRRAALLRCSMPDQSAAPSELRRQERFGFRLSARAFAIPHVLGLACNP